MAIRFDIPLSEIERRKENIRRVWNYQEVDHIPVCFDFSYNPWRYTIRDSLTSKEKQLKQRLYNIEKGLKEMPDDYIPGMFINIGCVGVDIAFGGQIHWADNPEQTPYIRGPVLKNAEDIFALKKPDIRKDGLFPVFLEWLEYFVRETEGKIPVSGLDNNGITGVAHDLLGAERFYLMLLDEPEAMDHLLTMISDTIIEFIDECAGIAGGLDNMTSVDWFYFWQPEGKKGHVSSDPNANYGKDLFYRFDVPYNNKVMEKYGPGLLHNCGPNPCGPYYLDHSPALSGVNLSYRYSKDDFPALKKTYRGRGVIYIIFDNESPEEALAGYNSTMEILAPDVIALPIVFIAEETEDILRLYERFAAVGKEYARRVWKAAS
ncbi:MAG: hypothetical protein E4H36_03745 [Spirochaetales bacterium]|nr:MAG: hypothetical protein E4H36_03745 [Spirochaetales bacterium]